MRIVIVVNKWWECEPALNAMINQNSWQASGAVWPSTLDSPQKRGNPNAVYTPRAVFDYTYTNKNTKKTASVSAEIYCISDFMNAVTSNQSSSEAKVKALATFFKQIKTPDLVIAVGTASSAAEQPNRNGGVAIGTAVFMHDAHPKSNPNPASEWRSPDFDKIIASSITAALFDKVAGFDAASALQHFMPVRHSSDAPVITAGLHDVALGTLNVTNYWEYKIKDPETREAYLQTKNAVASRAASIETTHGLIALAAGSTPFIFLSTLVDRFTYFDADVSTLQLSDAQNTACAYNAGVTLTWMLPNLAVQLTQ